MPDFENAQVEPETEPRSPSDEMAAAVQETDFTNVVLDFVTTPRRGSTIHADAQRLTDHVRYAHDQGLYHSRDEALGALSHSLMAYFSSTIPAQTRVGLFWRVALAHVLSRADFARVSSVLYPEVKEHNDVVPGGAYPKEAEPAAEAGIAA